MSEDLNRNDHSVCLLGISRLKINANKDISNNFSEPKWFIVLICSCLHWLFVNAIYGITECCCNVFKPAEWVVCNQIETNIVVGKRGVVVENTMQILVTRVNFHFTIVNPALHFIYVYHSSWKPRKSAVFIRCVERGEKKRWTLVYKN